MSFTLAPPPPRGVPLALLIALQFGGCSPGPSGGGISSPEPAPPPAPTALPSPAVSSVDTEGWIWTYHSDPPRALYGPPASEAALAVACSAEGPNRVEFTLFALAHADGSRELVIAGNGDERTVTLGATDSELADGPIWQGHSTIDAIGAPFSAGDGPVVFAAIGGPTLVVPDPFPVRSLLSDCAS